jgi:N-sulfoglucosamine sulfohydrolase
MKTPPNIIFIITHDTGTYFGCYGKPVKTPNIDKLAEEGILFTHHYSCAPQCTPSRGGILTGKMPHSNGLMGLTNMGWDLPEHNETIPKLLKKNGYSTHLIGLQHTQHQPKKLGYDTISPRSDAPHMGSSVTRRFKKFMKLVEKREIQQPFFCSVGFFETHRVHGYNGDDSSPFNSSNPRFPAESEEILIPPTLPEDSEEVQEDIADFVSSVKDFDHYLGKMLIQIENSSIKNDTIIIFTVDHGIPLPRQKCTLYDLGINVPLIMHMPSEIRGNRRIDDLVSNIDLLPTILELAGVKIPEDVQGNSVAGLVTEDANIKYTPREYINAELTFHDIGFNPIRCIRTKKWKYIRNLVPLNMLFEMPNDISHSKSGKVYLKFHPEYYSQRPDEELYDLESDPLETNNLAKNSKYIDIKNDLKSKLMTFLEKTNDAALKGLV